MFDLEKAIQEWRKALKRNESFEEAFIVELESHLRDEVDRLRRGGAAVEDAFREAAAGIGEAGDIGAEFECHLTFLQGSVQNRDMSGARQSEELNHREADSRGGPRSSVTHPGAERT